jgi:hypothetical protein
VAGGRALRRAHPSETLAYVIENQEAVQRWQEGDKLGAIAEGVGSLGTTILTGGAAGTSLRAASTSRSLDADNPDPVNADLPEAPTPDPIPDNVGDSPRAVDAADGADLPEVTLDGSRYPEAAAHATHVIGGVGFVNIPGPSRRHEFWTR